LKSFQCFCSCIIFGAMVDTYSSCAHVWGVS
jgi:hypothetical protein